MIFFRDCPEIGMERVAGELEERSKCRDEQLDQTFYQIYLLRLTLITS